ncbi:MAG: hypothetical protein RLZZ126_458 [Pseudomonadota bacterium]
MLAAREEAIVAAVNRLLAERGYDAMTVDDVAAEVGVAKPQLYRHFPSKEHLAAAAMVRVMEDAKAFTAQIDPKLAPVEQLKLITRWMLERKLAGTMPNLPSQNSKLRNTLLSDPQFVADMMQLGDSLGELILAAQRKKTLHPKLPAELVLYTLYARACDPVVEFMQISGQYKDAEILDWVMQTCFEGISV